MSTGALDGVEPSAEGAVEARQCPRGPMLLRGATSVQDAEGHPHPVTRPVVAVCVCGKTQRDPWCDGTHKVLRSR